MRACPGCKKEAAAWAKSAREATEAGEHGYARYARGCASSLAAVSYCFGPRRGREDCTGHPPLGYEHFRLKHPLRGHGDVAAHLHDMMHREQEGKAP